MFRNNVTLDDEQSIDTPAKRLLCPSIKKAKKISELKKYDKFYYWIHNGCSGQYIYEYTLIADPYYESGTYCYHVGNTLLSASYREVRTALPVFEDGSKVTYEVYAKHSDKEYSWDRKTGWVAATSLEKLVKVAKSKFKKDISNYKIKS